MHFHFMLALVFIVLKIILWPSAWKELSTWLSPRTGFILCRLGCMCSFPFGCLGHDMEFDCIGSWSLSPIHCPFIYLECRKYSHNSTLTFVKLADNQKRHLHAETNNYTRHTGTLEQHKKVNRKVREEPQAEIAANPWQEEEKKWHRLTYA